MLSLSCCGYINYSSGEKSQRESSTSGIYGLDLGSRISKTKETTVEEGPRMVNKKFGVTCVQRFAPNEECRQENEAL